MKTVYSYGLHLPCKAGVKPHQPCKAISDLYSDLLPAVLQIPVRRPEHLETTSLGAAFAAGIATGFWTKEWVLGGASDECGAYTDFLPRVSPHRMTLMRNGNAKWQKRFCANTLRLRP